MLENKFKILNVEFWAVANSCNMAVQLEPTMPTYKYDRNGLIKILNRTIPVESGTRLYAGYRALQKMEGKSYGDFRDIVGPKPRRPNKDDRKFSPSDTIRQALKNGSVSLISK